jgi:hypothetical protein
VGVAGRAECGDARLHDAMSPAAFTARVNAAGPFHVTRVYEVPVSSPAPDVLITGARYEALLSPLAAAAGTDRATLAAAVTARLRATEGEGTPGYVVLAWDAATLALAFELGARGGVKPFDVVARTAGVTPADARGAVITRLEVLGLT